MFMLLPAVHIFLFLVICSLKVITEHSFFSKLLGSYQKQSQEEYYGHFRVFYVYYHVWEFNFYSWHIEFKYV